MADANPFTSRVGPLAGWQWVAVIGGAGGVFLWYRQRQAAAAAATSSTTTGATDVAGTAAALDASGAGPLPGYGALEPVIIQEGAEGATNVGPVNITPTAPAPSTPAPPGSTTLKTALAPLTKAWGLPGEKTAATLRTPQYGPTAGYYLSNAGGIEAVGGAPFFGSYLGLPPSGRAGDPGWPRKGARTFTSIVAAPGGGYTITDMKGEHYTFNTKTKTK